MAEHPSLASRYARALRRRLRRAEGVKMTPEGRDFIAEYRAWLAQGIGKADDYLAARDGCSLVDVLRGSTGLMSELAELQARRGKQDLDLYMPIHTMVYLICKKMRPLKVIETGVEKGGTSHMILQALYKNDAGRLWSIDIGSHFRYGGSFISKIGPLVEEHTKPRWNLVQGNAQEVLGDVLGETGDIDVFCAGQGHTYEVQSHEGGCAWPRIRSGGVFVLDRADWCANKYLDEFMANHSGSIEWYETFKEGSIEDPFEFTVILKK